MSEHTHSGRIIRSGRGRPCPIDDCRREKDADCSRTEDGEQVWCHHAREDLKPGDRIGEYAFTGNTKDGRCAHFVRHREQQRPHRRTIVTSSPKGFADPNPEKQKAKPPRLSINQIELARCTPKPPTLFIKDGAKRVFRDVEFQLVASWITARPNTSSGGMPLMARSYTGRTTATTVSGSLAVEKHLGASTAARWRS